MAGWSTGSSDAAVSHEFAQYFKDQSGLLSKYIYSNLRVPNKHRQTKDEINIILLTGKGIFCIDIKRWTGNVSVRQQKWYLKVQVEGDCACFEQKEDPIKAIQAKTANLRSYLRSNGVNVDQAQMFSKVIFSSELCQLNRELEMMTELILPSQLDEFLQSFQVDFMTIISDALIPALFSGRMSHQSMALVHMALENLGTWDVLQLNSGQQLFGEYQNCQFLAVNRQETRLVKFSSVNINFIMMLLGYKDSKITATLYGCAGLLFETVNAFTTLPASTCVIFKIIGDIEDSQIPVDTIESIKLSI